MAYTKKSTTEKVNVDKTSTENNSVESKKEVKKFQPGDMILCRCVRPNKTIFHSTKTDTRYEFGGYGDLNEVDYADLLKFKSSRSPVLFQPKILIEDEDLRKQWANDLKDLADEYDGVYNTEELFKKTPSQFEKFLRNASPSIQELVKICTAKMIKDETLTDLRIIRLVDDILGTQFKEFV